MECHLLHFQAAHMYKKKRTELKYINNLSEGCMTPMNLHPMEIIEF